jgi:hypothetical protein
MKQTLVFIFFLLLFAKGFTQNKLQTGLIIGYNSSTFLGDDKPGIGLKPIPGFYLGGIVDYPINDRFSISSDIALDSRGTMINTINDLNEIILSLYFDIPILMKVNFRLYRKISPFVVLGGAFDYNLLSISASGGSLFDMKKVDLGLVSGMGVDIGKLSFGLRYNYGLTKFDKSNQDLNLRNSTLSILAGIRFNK